MANDRPADGVSHRRESSSDAVPGALIASTRRPRIGCRSRAIRTPREDELRVTLPEDSAS